MTGNSTRLVGVADWQRAALLAGSIIAVFVTGVVAGSLVAARAGAKRTPAILFCVAFLLAFAATLNMAEAGWPTILCLAFAMGIVNAAIEGRDGAVMGITYMTGTLVQMGQKIANQLRRDGDGRWLHHFGLWAGLVASAIVGARTLLWSAPLAYGLAILLAGALALRARWLARQEA